MYSQSSYIKTTNESSQKVYSLVLYTSNAIGIFVQIQSRCGSVIPMGLFLNKGKKSKNANKKRKNENFEKQKN